ncbi:MAG TPA: YfhO family protein, partial [Chthoniobacterales bacterium]|nr:YfhO family protein [Chthoniobacterales bacterium]
DFYKLIYAVPGLNLFRVPARHLMEVEFALAVLAGRGLTAIVHAPDRSKTLRWVLAAGLFVFFLTCLAITWGRPASFHLGRTAPVTILRAPELFLPPVLAAVSAWALSVFVRSRRSGALALLLAILLADLSLWGQSSGWRVSSPTSQSELWSEPAALQFLREHEGQATIKSGVSARAAPNRILTQDQFLDPDKPITSYAPASGWVPALQPDICMTHGWENAAGYDGFGLARYSRLAGDMKVWGDLADAERTLRSESREIDLLNVRYLLVRSASVAPKDQSASPAEPAATQVYDDQTFAVESLNLSGLVPGERLSFKVPPTETDHIALLTALAWSQTVPDRTVVAKIRLQGTEGETYDFELRAGDHTSEWAYDRPDIRSRIAHKRATIASSYTVTEAPASYEAHNYVSSFTLPRKITVTKGEITIVPVLGAPQLSLLLTQLSLAAGSHAFPLRSEWITRASEASAEQQLPATRANEARSPRWKRIAEVGKVAIFENTRVLPRAWLATGQLVVSSAEELGIIRSGKTPDGAPWNPLEKALVESSTGVSFAKGDSTGRAEVTRHEPNRVEVKTQSAVPSVLVLAENHYPGWRAKVDGHRAKVMRVNYNQRGVALSGGNHTVSFVYQPKSVLIGLLISLLAIVSLVLWERGLLPDRLTGSFGRSRKSEHD